MKVRDIMTSNPACCTPETSLVEAAQMMVDHDCGEIPVVDSFENYLPVGVITDRDITCRTVAKGLNPLEMTAADCMTTPLVSVKPDDHLEKCCRLMEENQIRRIPVVNDDGKCVGIVSLADIAQRASIMDSAEVLEEVTETSASASGIS